MGLQREAGTLLEIKREATISHSGKESGYIALAL